MKELTFFGVNLKNYYLFIASLFLASCVSHNHPQKKYRLSFKAQPQSLYKYSYRQFENKDLYFEGALFSTEKKTSEFEIEYKDHSDEKSDFTAVTLKTTRVSQGMVMAHLGYPELGDSIEMIWDQYGQVKKAGEHSSESLFFVPSIPLPKAEVSVGESWDFFHQWYSKEGLPIRIEAVVIFTRISSCPGGKSECAILELSGNTFLPTEVQNMLLYKAELQGLFAVEIRTGRLYSSMVKSLESYQSKEGPRENWSCLIGELTELDHQNITSSLFQCAK